MINYGIQNQHIQEVIEKRGLFSKNMITYYPIGFDKDIYYTNEVLRKVLGDPCYSWANPFCTSRNSFDQPQYYRKQTFPFMLMVIRKDENHSHTFPPSRPEEGNNIFRVDKIISEDVHCFMKIVLYFYVVGDKETFKEGMLQINDQEYVINSFVLYNNLQIGQYGYDNIGICIIDQEDDPIANQIYC